MSTTIERSPSLRGPVCSAPRAAVVRRLVGGFFLVMAGINAGIVAADPQTYRPFADGAYWSFVTTTWHDLVMPHARVWFLLLAGGELVLGLLLLRGGRAARAGWVGVIAFHVLLMAFGFGIWTWSLPALALLLPAARADWTTLAGAPAAVPDGPAPPEVVLVAGGLRRTPVLLGSTLALATAVVAASAYGLLAETPYRSLPEATVLGARAQDACSLVVAVLLLWLVRRPMLSPAADLARLGLLGYLAYSYLIYVTGVPMNRAFLVYVVIVALSVAGLAAGLARVAVQAVPTSAASRGLVRGTGWMLVTTGVLFAGLWLSTLLPFALGGARPDPEGVGGTPYPVFWLDLAIVLPAIVAVGVLLLRDRPAGPPLAVVALIKVVTLFTALWAGPVVALVTSTEVHLGPDAGPSIVLLAVSGWLASRWLSSFTPPPH
ncbi:hypothetical protein Q9S36_36230 [Microbacterium sp. ARD31]|uniref:hypothetical protein n=1 Tax=Microbacterium sp. ARD31 TaxID=2962576 RepID=UPI00288223F5|nr:hypothetical protein [Microbacterium sp. ARD31]MDT0185648.1 hypothetical protein [Microbacterium sp. ARD31]